MNGDQKRGSAFSPSPSILSAHLGKTLPCASLSGTLLAHYGCSTVLLTCQREQLTLLVLACSLVSIAVISIASWVVNHDYVERVKQDSLSLTAALYAAQLLSSLTILQSAVLSISSRILIQSAIQRYNFGNTTYENWARSQTDLQTALNSGSSAAWLLQAQVQAMNQSSTNGNNTLLRATGSNVGDANILLPYHINGSNVYLGEDTGGYPMHLYPNLTYHNSVENGQNVTTTYFNETPLHSNSTILLGPWILNQTYSLMSITCAIINTTDRTTNLGWLTVVTNADLIQQVMSATEGLGGTGVLLLIGPSLENNTFPPGVLYDENRPVQNFEDDQQIRFVLPPAQNSSRSNRHSTYAHATAANNWNDTFALNQFPAAEKALTVNNHDDFNSGSMLDTRNEGGDRVAVGFAFPHSNLVDWALLVEQSYDEVVAPLNYLRNVLVACLFGTIGAVILVAFPSAHYFVRPIRRLREATTRSVEGSSGNSDKGSIHTAMSLPYAENVIHEKTDTRTLWRKAWDKIKAPSWAARHSRRGSFRIPKKVHAPKHIIKDELTDLTRTFNEMVDELSLQYTRLDEKVKERTAELELSKKAAEAANEAKTLFIANISHELKTPLNGILGMCAVSMHETDMMKVKRSLGIIHKSGDLLLHLLTDLLTFSKNQVGQHIKLEEKEFRLGDISSQVSSIFEQQAREGFIDFSVQYEGPKEETLPGDSPGVLTYGPHGTGRVQDMLLWGDQHRLLQVIINLVSNSLKFTPKGGKVTVMIKCLGAIPDVDEIPSSRHNSRQSSRLPRLLQRGRKTDSRNSSSGGSTGSTNQRAQSNSSNISTALEINSVDPISARKVRPKNKQATEVQVRDVSPSPPPHARAYAFEFSVEDTGPGIHPDQQESIFEPFVQGDLGLSKKYGGTGLGLSICQQLAKLMKGRITLESEPTKGSKFTMNIPLRYIKGRTESMTSSKFDGSRRHSLQLSRNVSDASPPWGPPDNNVGKNGKRRSRIGPPTGTVDLTAPPGHESDGHESDASAESGMSTHSAPANYRDNLAPQHRNPRLVGLSQPYFATTPPLEDESTRFEAMERVTMQAQKSGRRVRVLVAEDNKINQEVVLKMLRLEEIYDVIVASDGQQAFDYVKNGLEKNPPEYFDLIFMDVQMPNVDGLQSTRLIRGAGYSAPIVALTAFAEESNQQECMDSGMDYFLPKPIRRPALKQVLKKFCPTIPEEGEDGDSVGRERVVAIVRKSVDKVREGAGVDLNHRRRSSLGKRPGIHEVEVDLTNIGHSEQQPGSGSS